MAGLNQDKQRSRQASPWFLVMFLVPFFGFAVFAIVMGVRELTRGETGTGLGLIGFGVVFGGFAGLFLWVALLGNKKAQEQQALRTEHADAPWRIRNDWVAGEIRSSAKAGMIGAWIFAGIWNAISWPVVFAVPEEWAKGNRAILVGLLFPLVGLGLLTWAVRATIRWRKYGESILTLATLPAAIGGVLAGVLRLRTPLVGARGITLQLSCINRVTTGSGKNRSTSEHVKWQDEQLIAAQQDVPVHFRIPDDGLPVDDTNSRNVILWRLDAKADTPGVDYHAQFEVPVFHVGPKPAAASSPPGGSASESVAGIRAAAERLRDRSPLAEDLPPQSKIRFDRYARAGATFHFPPARNLGAAFGLTAFFVVWTGLFWLLFEKNAPMFFKVIWGLFDLLIFVGVLQTWFASSRVVIDQTGITVRGGLLGLGRTRRVARSEIAEIKLAVGMQSGNRVYHDIQLHRTDGKTLKLASSIREKRQADWLVDKMCDCLSGRD